MHSSLADQEGGKVKRGGVQKSDVTLFHSHPS